MAASPVVRCNAKRGAPEGRAHGGACLFPTPPAGHQLGAWLEAFTGGFDPRRIEQLDGDRLVVLLQERRQAHYARVSIKVSPDPPHAVVRFQGEHRHRPGRRGTGG